MLMTGASRLCLPILFVGVLSLGGALSEPAGAAPVQTFTLVEHFGVNHPDQVVTFDLNQDVVPGNCYLVNDAGEEMPYQILSGGEHGQLALTTDLPADTTRVFTLHFGRAPRRFPDVVILDETHPDYLQITNGLTGIRVPKVYAPLTTSPKCPVQGVQFRDGTWSPPGTPIGFTNSNNEGSITSVDAMEVTIRERGPIRTTVEVTYRITCPAMAVGEMRIRDDAPAHYTTVVTVEKGQPSILFETDADVYSTYSFSLYEGTRATQLRYIGHHATAPEFGRHADGSRYTWETGAMRSNALVDIDYATPVEVNYVTTKTTRQWLALWNPWAVNSGWYWQMYDADGPANSNVMGIFAGPPGRMIAAGCSGPGIYNRPDPDVGVSVLTNLRGADNSRYYYATSYKTVRFAWGLFAGTKADLPDDLTEVPTISKQFCLHGNGMTLNKLNHYQLEYPDPPGFGQMYMPREALDALITRAREDDDYFRYIYNTSPYSRDIWDMWRDTTGARTHQMAAALHSQLAGYIDDWENGWGYLSNKYTTQPWLLPAPMADRYDQLLHDPKLTPEERVKVKAGAAFFANWLWDYDAYPLRVDPVNGAIVSCVNLGTANMPQQWIGTRSLFTWYLATHPVISQHLGESEPDWWLIADDGSSASCPHYAQTMEPTFNVVMVRNQVGKHDWRDEPKLAKFAEWQMNLMTPVDPRFGRRSQIADGNSQAGELPHMLALNATACAEDLPELSRKMMWLWMNNGRPQSDFYGSTVLRIDESLPTEDPRLGNACFPNYYAVLRHGWGTPEETSIHLIGGPFYQDHRDYNSGNLHLFALGAPLALDWESMYSPVVVSAAMHNLVIPEAEWGMPWNADIPKRDDGHFWVPGDPWAWRSQTQAPVLSFAHSGVAQFHTAHNGPDLDWTRTVTSIFPDPAFPLILVRDQFGGARADESMTFNLTQMATGAVLTPAGPVLPEPRFYDLNGEKQAPSGGEIYDLPAGLNRFQFTGQQFGTAGVTPAIDWDLYDVAPGPRQFCIGSWGHNSACGKGGEYAAANNGAAYEQRQYLFHLKGTGGFRTLLVPRRKGTPPPVVTLEGEALVVALGEATVRITDGNYSFTGPTRDVVSTHDAQGLAALGMRVQGGPTEVVYDKVAKTLTITAHGAAGPRQITVPTGAWTVESGAASNVDGKWALDYQGGDPAVVVLAQAGG